MRKFLWVIVTVCMFVLNYLSSTNQLGINTTQGVSAKFDTLITPFGPTFAIRGVIYLGLLIVGILYLFQKKVILKSTYPWYILSCIANGLWILARQNEYLHLSMILIVVLLFSLIMIDYSIKHHSKLKYYNIIRNVFLLYFGRVQIATLVMTTIYLSYQLGRDISSGLYRAIGCIATAGVINTIVLQKEKNITTSVVAMRALIGIANSQSNTAEGTILWKVCVLVFGILAIQIAFQALFYLFSKSRLQSK